MLQRDARAALRFIKEFVQDFPIPKPTDDQRAAASSCVGRLIDLKEQQHATRRDLLDWLRVQHEIERPNTKLHSPTELDSDGFVAEVKKLRGKKRPLSAAALKSLRDEHARTIEPAQRLAAGALRLEREVSDLVNAAYGLTPEETALMWQTAPPRMPNIGP
ncbi:MAG: hypothetical protein HY000_24645 [Planctomycetes bacterium]|nr:hypothetical protein [Planctomycetota bacterium]